MLRILKKKKLRQWVELEEEKWVIKEGLSTERADASVHKPLIRNVTCTSLHYSFVISGRGP